MWREPATCITVMSATLIAALAWGGVRFKACRISMRGHGYTDADFPLEVEFVPAGAPEMIRLQMEGYRYWRPWAPRRFTLRNGTKLSRPW